MKTQITIEPTAGSELYADSVNLGREVTMLPVIIATSFFVVFSLAPQDTPDAKLARISWLSSPAGRSTGWRPTPTDWKKKVQLCSSVMDEG